MYVCVYAYGFILWLPYGGIRYEFEFKYSSSSSSSSMFTPNSVTGVLGYWRDPLASPSTRSARLQDEEYMAGKGEDGVREYFWRG